MMRAGLHVTLAVVLGLAAGGVAAAQDTYNPNARDMEGVPQGGDSLQSEETGADLRPLPLGCVAIAVDTKEGGEGNGRGKTLKAAEENAMELCHQSGGKNCSIEASSCNPEG